MRRELERFRGREVKTLGDGFLATFDGPARGDPLRPRDPRRGRAQLGIEIRAGLHTGEVEVIGDDVGGIAVHIAARVGALGRARRGAGVEHGHATSSSGSGLEFDDARHARAEGRAGRMEALRRGGLIAVLALLVTAGAALGANVYSVGGGSPTPGHATNSKPIPAALNFDFQVEDEDPDLRGTPIETFAIGAEGIVTYPKLFPACSFSDANADGHAKSCRKARVGNGLVPGDRGASADPACEAPLQPQARRCTT